MTLNDKRVALITAVQAAGKIWDACAKSDAMEAVRAPHDKAKQERAARTVACADTSHELTDQVIRLINQHWPCDKETP